MAENPGQDNPKPKKPAKDPADASIEGLRAGFDRAQARAAANGVRPKISVQGYLDVATDETERDAANWQIKYNEFSCQFFVNGAPLEKEIHAYDLARQLQRIKKLKKIGIEAAFSVLKRVGRNNAFNPVVDELRKHSWDGVSRLANVFPRYFGAIGDPNYLQRVGPWFFIGHVGRLLSPGSRQDSMLVLEGGEGLGKTQFCRLLAQGDDYYRENLPDLHTADAKEALIGKRVVEMSELVALASARSQETFKAFASTSKDNVRLPYGERSKQHPRTASIIGTTNPQKYLSSAYGNRRIWGVACGAIDLPGLERDLGQLFAEATVRYEAGEKWWPDQHEQTTIFSVQQNARLETDPYAEAITGMLNNDMDAALRSDWTARELFDEVVSRSKGAFKMDDWPRLASKAWPNAMRKAGLVPILDDSGNAQKQSSAARGWVGLWERPRTEGGR